MTTTETGAINAKKVITNLHRLQAPASRCANLPGPESHRQTIAATRRRAAQDLVAIEQSGRVPREAMLAFWSSRLIGLWNMRAQRLTSPTLSDGERRSGDVLLVITRVERVVRSLGGSPAKLSAGLRHCLRCGQPECGYAKTARKPDVRPQRITVGDKTFTLTQR